MDVPGWPPDDAAADDDLLARLGWDDGRQQEFDQLGSADAVPGRVARVDRGACTVLSGNAVHRAVVPPRFPTPAAGDWAVVRPAVAGGDDATLRALLERRTTFTRHAAGEETIEQVVAANIDVIFVVSALDQRFSLRRLERYLTLGWQSGATPVIVLTKTDLCPDVDAVVLEAESIAFGVDVLAVSAETGEGLDRIRAHMAGNRTVALLGLSGAGKSTLINRLIGEERLATQDVRQDGRGRHTTTHRELIALPAGGVVIDTPGMRSVGLWDGDGGAGLEQTFADVHELAAECRFSDCSHDGEPGCAVTAAIAKGTLPAERLESYSKLLRELRFQELKQDKRARSEQRKHYRVMNRAMRKAPKPERD